MENRIRELREERGLTQKALAFKLNVVQQTVSRFERNTCSLPADILVQLTKLFHVSADYILKLSDSRMTAEYPVEVKRFSEKYMHICLSYDRLNKENQRLVSELITKLGDGQHNAQDS